MLISFMTQDKLLLIFLLNILKEFQKLKVEQNKKEQDLKENSPTVLKEKETINLQMKVVKR